MADGLLGLKEEATVLRFGLTTGCASVQEVIAWSDDLIGRDQGNAVPQLFDLALLRQEDTGRAVSLLGEVPGAADPARVGRHIARRVRALLEERRLGEVEAARTLFIAMLEGFAPDGDFENKAYYFDDAVAMAVAGIHGRLAQVRRELLDYLRRF